ncbi:MAG TPA: hypothetical protein VNL74_07705 [Methylococcus sp.]|nr:hypothetical protein [Methylococcus sp.]
MSLEKLLKPGLHLAIEGLEFGASMSDHGGSKGLERRLGNLDRTWNKKLDVVFHGKKFGKKKAARPRTTASHLQSRDPG